MFYLSGVGLAFFLTLLLLSKSKKTTADMILAAWLFVVTLHILFFYFRQANLYPQLLVGDLNTTRHEPLFREIKTEWVDLYDQAGNGWGLNFPHSEKLNPVFTLDYIFGRGLLEALELRVVEDGGSDHLAIAGKIKI
jgi:endonuclease/exonuclease/phosphatase family metal-dependent hydrolase